MNPSRFVAALAALAVGFGITLVGVSTDGADETNAAQVVVVEERPESIDDEAVEDVPDAAADEVVTETTDAGAEPSIPGDIVSDVAEEAPSAEQPEEPPIELPPGVECGDALVVIGQQGETVVLVRELDEYIVGVDGKARLAVEALPITDLPSVEFVVDVVGGLFDPGSGPKFVDCATRAFVTEIDPDEFRDVLLEEGEDGSSASQQPGDGGQTGSSSQSDQPGTDPSAEESGERRLPCENVDIVSIAKRFVIIPEVDAGELEFGSYVFIVTLLVADEDDPDFDEIANDVDDLVDRFRDECPDRTRDAGELFVRYSPRDLDASDFAEMLCGLVIMSADDELLRFMVDDLGAFSSGFCEYE